MHMMNIIIVIFFFFHGVLSDGLRTKFYSGHFPTPTEWEADLISNGNIGRFCAGYEAGLAGGSTAMEHYTGDNSNRGGEFYVNWYYLGSRYCPDDTLIYSKTSNSTPCDRGTVWQYKGFCGSIVNIPGPTYERRAMITCTSN